MMSALKRVIGILGLLLLAVPLLVSGQEDHKHQSDPDECAKLPAQLKLVLAAMDGPGKKLDAIMKRGEMTALSPALQRLDVVLHPSDHVLLTATSKSEKKSEGQTFAGYVAFSVPHDGEYRVSVDTTAWIDVLDGDMVVERTKLNRRMQCGHVHKSLGFTLKTGVNYWLQLSFSKAPEVHLVLTPEESS
jgi:hypothetical protein